MDYLEFRMVDRRYKLYLAVVSDKRDGNNRCRNS